MKRSINSTGRQRISHGLVSFNIIRKSTGEPMGFTADLTGLTALGLPNAARVSVEPYLGHSAMQFDFGTVGAIVAPTNTNLDEIDHGGEINFRVKVTDDGGAGHMGRLLAMGDRISASPPKDPGHGQLPLLPVKPEWLDERIWDISTNDGERPYLLINSRIKGLSTRLQDDPLLRGAILIEAFRKVLCAMLITNTSDEPAWVGDWKIFLNTALLVPFPEDIDPEDDDEAQAFITEALKAFSNKFQFATLAFPTESQEDTPHD
jgi:hypothetical protein